MEVKSNPEISRSKKFRSITAGGWSLHERPSQANVVAVSRRIWLSNVCASGHLVNSTLGARWSAWAQWSSSSYVWQTITSNEQGAAVSVPAAVVAFGGIVVDWLCQIETNMRKIIFTRRLLAREQHDEV